MVTPLVPAGPSRALDAIEEFLAEGGTFDAVGLAHAMRNGAEERFAPTLAAMGDALPPATILDGFAALGLACIEVAVAYDAAAARGWTWVPALREAFRRGVAAMVEEACGPLPRPAVAA